MHILNTGYSARVALVSLSVFRLSLVFCSKRLDWAAAAGQLDEIGKTCALDVALSCLQAKADYVPAAAGTAIACRNLVC